MEIREMNREDLLRGIENYENELAVTRKYDKICGYLYIAFIVLLFLYFKFFNTKFEFGNEDWTGAKSIKVQYSTAWYIRIPAEYEGEAIDHMDRFCYLGNNDGSFFERCPNLLVMEIEEGIKSFHEDIFLLSWSEEPNFFWLRLPKNITIENGHFHYTMLEWPDKVTFE